MVHGKQVVYVSKAYLGGEAGVDGAAARACPVERIGGEVAEDDVAGLKLESLKPGPEEGCGGVQIQYAGGYRCAVPRVALWRM